MGKQVKTQFRGAKMRDRWLKTPIEIHLTDMNERMQALLNVIKDKDSESFYSLLTANYIDNKKSLYPLHGHQEKTGICLYRYYNQYTTQPLVEHIYRNDVQSFKKIIDAVLKQNDNNLCYQLIRVLHHPLVTEINAKRVLSFNRNGIDYQLNELKQYRKSERWVKEVTNKRDKILQLHKQLDTALNAFMPDEENIFKKQVQIIQFKLNMSEILHGEDALLTRHRNPQLYRVLGDLIVALMFGGLLNVANKVSTGHWSFFNANTESQGLVLNTERALYKEEDTYKTMHRLT